MQSWAALLKKAAGALFWGQNGATGRTSSEVKTILTFINIFVYSNLS